MALAMGLTSSAIANAAEVRILAANATKPVITEVASRFEHNTGHKLLISYQGGAAIEKTIDRGDPFDIVLLVSSNMNSVANSGKIDISTRVDFARSSIGVAVRAGQPKSDIKTPESFKNALLNAKSIVYVSSGASGKHFEKICKQMGITEQISGRLKAIPTGSAAELVANGEAELAVQQMSEVLSVKGVDAVGSLPPTLDLVSEIAAAIGGNSHEPDAAKSFIKFLRTPDVAKVLTSKGLEPI